MGILYKKEVPMRKGGFNMYLTKEKENTNLYKNYQPKFTKYQDAEIEAYVANAISTNLSKHMKVTVHSLAVMIAQGFTKGGK